MRAVVYFGQGKGPSIEDVTLKEPGPGEVRVTIKASGLCHSDVSVIDGTIPFPTPVVLGHEGAGIVDAVGPGVHRVKEGDHVVISTLQNCGQCAACGLGRPTECRNPPALAKPFSLRGMPLNQFANTSTFADQTVIRESGAIKIDPRVPFDRACLIGCGVATGVGAVLNRAKVESGATMAVFGAGGIGLNAIQGGVLAGAAQIIAVDVMEQKLNWARRFGATDVIDASKVDPVQAIKDLTGGGADHTFECIGNTKVIKQALDALGPGGTLTIVGVPKIGTPFEFVVHSLYQNKAIQGCRYGAARPHHDFPMMANLYLSGRLKVDELITKRYHLEDVATAIHDLERGTLARGVFTLGE